MTTRQSEKLNKFSQYDVLHSDIIQTKHIIINFSTTSLPPSIMAGYLSCVVIYI